MNTLLHRYLPGLLITLLVLSACAPAAAPSPAPAAAPAEAVLVRAITTEPAKLDPQGPPNSALSLLLPYL